VVIECQLQDDRRYVAITIRDQGMGMSPEQLQRVFERFTVPMPQVTFRGRGWA
jgi:signal transduction histidine kinase